MKRFVALFAVYGLVLAPLHANAAAVHPVAASATRGASAPAPASLLEAAEIAAASGVYRAQNTATITTGLIREDDKKRSAIAFALSGALAFGGAALWRWLPCRGQDPHGFVDQYEGFQQWHEAQCYDDDGERLGWDTPTKALFGAGVALELVSLFYLVRHLRDDGQPDDAQPASP